MLPYNTINHKRFAAGVAPVRLARPANATAAVQSSARGKVSVTTVPRGSASATAAEPPDCWTTQ